MRSFLNIKNLWKENLDELCANGFSLFLESRTESGYDSWIEADGEEELNHFIDVEIGATKLVIIDRRIDWVLKIPFAGKKMDYCAREAEVYHKAVEAEIEEYFASCYFLMNYEGAPCYIMEKVECDSAAVESDFMEKSSGTSLEYMDEDEFSEYITSLEGSEIVDGLFNFYYNEDTLKKIKEFTRKNSINDVHTGNVGYRDGQLVMVDYSGYFH